HQTSSDRNVMLEWNALFKAQGKPVDQLVLGIVHQQNGEHLVVNDLKQQIAYAFEELIKVENRCEILADLVQQQKGIGLAHDARIEPGILNAYRDAGGNQGQQSRMFVFKISGLGRFYVDDPNDPVLGDQRDSQFGAHMRNRCDVRGFLGDIVYQDGPALLDRSPGDPLSDLHPDPFRHVRGVTNLKSEPQLLSALIQEQNGEDFIVNNALYHLGHALEQCVQFQRGIENVRDLYQHGLNVD